MILYAHKKTVHYYDYDSYLESEEGLAWSSSGKAQDARGFEHGRFETILASKREGLPEGFEIRVGEEIERKNNLNPHGLM